MQFSDLIKIEILKAGMGLLTLGIGWFIGQRIIVYWDVKKKRQELDIGIATHFYELYGEFKEVSRLWRTFRFSQRKLNFPENMPIELLRRATAAEGGVEAMIMKLATERELNGDDVRTLGLFRQAFQKLREAIRDNAPLDWIYGAPEYNFFNDLTSRTACVITGSRTRREYGADKAASTLRGIAAIRPEHWENEMKGELGHTMNTPAQYFRAGVGAVIFNESGLILALERRDVPGAWQLPQGGLERGEEPHLAVLREITEETGLTEADLELVGSYPEPLVYELPPISRNEKTGRGQVQYWFLLRFNGHGTIALGEKGEFRSWRWIPLAELIDSTVSFRKSIYSSLNSWAAPYLNKQRGERA